jgi:hypothetical protein
VCPQYAGLRSFGGPSDLNNAKRTGDHTITSRRQRPQPPRPQPRPRPRPPPTLRYRHRCITTTPIHSSDAHLLSSSIQLCALSRYRRLCFLMQRLLHAHSSDGDTRQLSPHSCTPQTRRQRRSSQPERPQPRAPPAPSSAVPAPPVAPGCAPARASARRPGHMALAGR